MIMQQKAVKLMHMGIVVLGLSSCGVATMQDDIRRLQSSMNDLRAFQAEQTTKISALDTQVRQMSGRLERRRYKGLNC